MATKLKGEFKNFQAGLEYFAPNWFATALGTGGLALAIYELPFKFAAKIPLATTIWLIALVILIIVSGTTLYHRFTMPERIKTYIKDPIVGFFYGAMPMAIIIVGGGFLLYTRPFLGETIAFWICFSMWIFGTVQASYIALRLVYISFMEHEFRINSVVGGWMMPLVPSLLVASTGALIIPYTSPTLGRNMLLVCYGYLGFGIISSFIVLVQIWQRLAQYKIDSPVFMPTFWIVLGPLGQTITSFNSLAKDGERFLPNEYAIFANGLSFFGGVLIWGFATFWLLLVLAMTIKTAIKGMPFSLTWWSFTFPLAVYSTGSSAIAQRVDALVFSITAAIAAALLAVIWVYILYRTIKGVLDKSLLEVPVTAIV
ncbi:MAG: hypothetical protein QM571_07615 [Micrococcaceae bacterium]